jgi:hypothetical protein
MYRSRILIADDKPSTLDVKQPVACQTVAAQHILTMFSIPS